MGGDVQCGYQGLLSDRRAGGIDCILVQVIRWQIHQGVCQLFDFITVYHYVCLLFFISTFNHLISFLSACQGVGESGGEFVSLPHSTCLFCKTLWQVYDCPTLKNKIQVNYLSL